MLYMTGKRILTIYNIFHPFVVQRAAIQRKQSRFGRYLTISGIPQTLPLWTVRGHPAVNIVQLRTHIRLI